jgi:L-aspartate oxidase
LAELAPRDIVARAIHRKTRAGQNVFLDLRPVLSGEHSNSFPHAIQTARAAGFDPYLEPLPITPAAHYHMGGIEVDSNGRSSIEGLWACGEVATTGIHGANRLASNSLLEAVVYARRVADNIRDHGGAERDDAVSVPTMPKVPADHASAALRRIVNAIQKTMSQYVGILRDGADLETGIGVLSRLGRELRDLNNGESTMTGSDPGMVRRWGEAQNMLLVARLVSYAALQREESRGAHYRDDYPTARPEWRRKQSITVDALAERTGSG